MKLGIIGLGLRANHVVGFLADYIDDLEIVGYVDPNPCGKDELAKKIAVGKSFSTVEDLVKEKLDLLVVASPNHMHLSHIKIGLEAGVRVFSEKPIVISKQESFDLASLLAKHGTDQVLVGLVLRYSHHMRDLRKAQEDNLLGKVVSIEANEHIAPYHGAFFMRDWRRQEKISGGFMLEKCCHDLDIYNMITNSRPRKVASFGGRNTWIADNKVNDQNEEVYYEKKSFWEAAENPFTSDGNIVDNQVAILEYESNARLAFHTNTNVPDELRRFCVIGVDGMAEGDFVRGNLKITDAKTRKTVREHDYRDIEGGGAHYGADALMAKDIADYLTGKLTTLPVSVKDCIEAGLVAMAIDEARTNNSVVDLTETWAKFDEILK